MGRDLLTRLAKGAAANAVSQLIAALFQFVTIPILIGVWGMDLYSDWLILSAIPAALMLSDFGFGTAAANEMTMRVGRDDRPGALKVMQSVWAAVSVLSLVGAGLAVLAAVSLPWTEMLRLETLGRPQAMAVGLVLLVQVVARQQLTVLSGGYRCDGLYARGVMGMNFVRLGSLGLGLAALAYQNSVLAYAVGFAAAHVIGLAWMGFDLARKRPWVRLGWALAELAELKPLIAPAVSFVAYSMGLAFSLQGMLMVIKIALGGPAVVLFDTMRKVSRLINQASSVISQPVWVELSSSLGRDDLETGRKLHARVTQATVWVGVLSASVLAVFGQHIYELLTKKSAAFDGPVFWLLLGTAVLGSLWASSGTVLSAVNKHQRMTFVLVVVTGLSLAAAVPLMRQFGLAGAAVAAIAGEAIMWVWVTRSALQLLEDRVGSLIRVLFTNPLAKKA